MSKKIGKTTDRFDQSDIDVKTKIILRLKEALEKSLDSIKSNQDSPVDVAPFGVKICGPMSGIKCIFMDQAHIGVYEDVLLERFVEFLDTSKVEDGLQLEKKAAFTLIASEGTKKSRNARKFFDSGLLRLRVTFENRIFKVEPTTSEAQDSAQK